MNAETILLRYDRLGRCIGRLPANTMATVIARPLDDVLDHFALIGMLPLKDGGWLEIEPGQPGVVYL